MKKIYLILLLSVIIFYGCESSVMQDPATTIQYSIPERSNVKVTIENSYNTVIATIVENEHMPGLYQITYDSSNLAEGIYFYTVEVWGIESNSYSKITKPMVLIK